jgi:hypothetical protein
MSPKTELVGAMFLFFGVPAFCYGLARNGFIAAIGAILTFVGSFCATAWIVKSVQG